MARKTKLDFYFANHGSITVLTPLTKAATAWINENLRPGNPELQFLGTGAVIEPRFAGDVLQGLQDDGLTVGC